MTLPAAWTASLVVMFDCPSRSKSAGIGWVCPPSDSKMIHLVGALDASRSLSATAVAIRISVVPLGWGWRRLSRMARRRSGLAGSSLRVRIWNEESKMTTPGAMDGSQPAMKREAAATACSKGVPSEVRGAPIEEEPSRRMATAAWGSAVVAPQNSVRPTKYARDDMLYPRQSGRPSRLCLQPVGSYQRLPPTGLGRRGVR